MKKFHPLYLIGTAGTIIAATLHLILALVFSLSSVHSTFFVVYSNFVIFMIIGFGLTIKKQKENKKLSN